ncbi:hypothetical protein F442_09618 [Phytophthora nicotianae P10297]|uniref:Uncharacterized protein n=1 Tax=Phytophthora nicotianae P10297 TaxID=1317064 RepID=W2Z8X7_PHYNI|nr:hypothetical protein F442_09618 [Phytophthora nicotianae P10297]
MRRRVPRSSRIIIASWTWLIYMISFASNSTLYSDPLRTANTYRCFCGGVLSLEAIRIFVRVWDWCIWRVEVIIHVRTLRFMSPGSRDFLQSMAKDLACKHLALTPYLLQEMVCEMTLFVVKKLLVIFVYCFST